MPETKPRILATRRLPPNVEAPADLTVEATNPFGETVSLGEPVITGSCDPTPQVTNDAPALFPLGPTVVTWTVVDGEQVDYAWIGEDDDGTFDADKLAAIRAEHAQKETDAA